MSAVVEDRTLAQPWVGVGAAASENTALSPEVLRALPVAVYTTDANGRITFFNEAAVDLWGLRPELGKAEWCGSWRLCWPDGRPMPHDQCSMAVALKEDRAIRGAEAVAIRPDGVHIPFLAFPTPLHDQLGGLIGAVNTLVNITERKQAEEVAQRLASIVSSSDDAIVSKNLDGVITTWNAGAERLFGYTAEEAVGKPITFVIPQDLYDEERDILDRIRRGEHIDHYETVRLRKDGTSVEISLTVSPIKGAGGRIVGASKIARNITESKLAQEQQQLLIREMNHRIKNLFAVAAGVVTVSARTARTPEEMAGAVRERLAALTRAHELIRPGSTGAPLGDEPDATLAALIQTIFAPYCAAQDSDRRCLILNGPEIHIGRDAITSFALILHEFATNAVKYGALTSPTGRIEIDWTVEDGALALAWSEHGGPAVTQPPEGHGFGTLLARRTISGAFGGKLDYDWRPEGLIVRLKIPLDRLGGLKSPACPLAGA